MTVRTSVCAPLRMKQLGPHWTDFHEISYLSTFRKSVEKIKVSLKYHRITGTTGTLYEDLLTSVIASSSVLLRMRHV